ncbi:hypothetical protein FPHOBKDP_00233 [Listeria phage LPJP1]|nr:hypothetical protein FPHOBKDP_00233 [Listeria phage LPJP1]
MVMRSDEFRMKLRISKKKLETLEKEKIIKPIRKGRLKYYTDEMVDDYFELTNNIKPEEKRKIVAYYRVSTSNQKKELENQRQSIETFSVNSGKPVNIYLSDIASGINFKRKNFLKLIDMIENKEVSELIITYKDRLTRFGFELIEERCKVNGTTLTVINLESSSPEKELVDDLMTIIHVFSSRLYGLRKYKKTLRDDLDDNKSKNQNLS